MTPDTFRPCRIRTRPRSICAAANATGISDRSERSYAAHRRLRRHIRQARRLLNPPESSIVPVHGAGAVRIGYPPAPAPWPYYSGRLGSSGPMSQTFSAATATEYGYWYRPTTNGSKTRRTSSRFAQPAVRSIRPPDTPTPSWTPPPPSWTNPGTDGVHGTRRP